MAHLSCLFCPIYTKPWKAQHPACVHCIRVHSWISSFWPIVCASPQTYDYCLYTGSVWVKFKMSFPESWEFIAVSDGHLLILSSGASTQMIAVFVFLDELPERWIAAELYHQTVICQDFPSSGAPHEWGWASERVIKVVWASDRSVGVMRQVRRCKAEQDDGLINPATPPVWWERFCSHRGAESNKLPSSRNKLARYTQVTDKCYYMVRIAPLLYYANIGIRLLLLFHPPRLFLCRVS